MNGGGRWGRLQEIAKKHLRQWMCSAAQLEILPEDRDALMEEKGRPTQINSGLRLWMNKDNSEP